MSGKHKIKDGFNPYFLKCLFWPDPDTESGNIRTT